MSKRLLTILLLISLAFNLAVVGRYAYFEVWERPHFNPSHHPRGRMENNRNRFDKGRNNWMADCMKQGMEHCQPYRDTFQVDRTQFIETLKVANFNEANAKAALEKSLKAHANMEQALGMNLIEMRKKMTAAQAREFFDRRFEHKNPDKNNPGNRHYNYKRRTK